MGAGFPAGSAPRSCRARGGRSASSAVEAFPVFCWPGGGGAMSVRVSVSVWGAGPNGLASQPRRGHFVE